MTGIYKIESVINPELFYIGSSVNIKNRFRKGHRNLLFNNKHPNNYLQNHFNKYGIVDLILSVIEICPKEMLAEKEQYWIDILHPKFNICKIAQLPPNHQGRKHSIKEIEKRTNSQKIFWNSERGMKVKLDSSIRQTGVKKSSHRSPLSDKERINMSILHKNKRVTINTRNKSSISHKLYFATKEGIECRKKVSDKLSGINSYRFGIKMTEEEKNKLRKPKKNASNNMINLWKDPKYREMQFNARKNKQHG